MIGVNFARRVAMAIERERRSCAVGSRSKEASHFGLTEKICAGGARRMD